MHLQIFCLIIFWKRYLGSYISKPCSHISEPHSHVFGHHFLGSIFFEPYFVVFKSHFFKYHIISSLHLFNLVIIAPDPCFWNTGLILVMSMQCVSKQASWLIYKDNSCDIKFSCRAIKRKQSELDNPDQITRIEYPRLKDWEDLDRVFHYHDFIWFGVKRPVYWPRILSIRMTV